MKAGSARPYTMSLALHVAVGALLITGIHFSRPITVPPAPVEAVMADRAVLDAVAQQQRLDQQRAREAAARAAQQRAAEQARLEQQRQAAEQSAAEQARLAAQQQAAADARRKAEVAAAAKRQADAAAAAKRKAQEAAAAKRKAEQEAASRKAREQAAAAAAAKRKAEADAQQRARREADLQARLADEERHSAAVSSGLRNQYVGLLQAKIERNWIRPQSARAGLKCTLHITQIPGGEVVNASLGDCNGDAVVKQSILDAVLRASPLPAPPDPSLFERNLNIVFEPKD